MNGKDGDQEDEDESFRWCLSISLDRTFHLYFSVLFSSCISSLSTYFQPRADRFPWTFVYPDTFQVNLSGQHDSASWVKTFSLQPTWAHTQIRSRTCMWTHSKVSVRKMKNKKNLKRQMKSADVIFTFNFNVSRFDGNWVKRMLAQNYETNVCTGAANRLQKILQLCRHPLLFESAGVWNKSPSHCSTCS